MQRNSRFIRAGDRQLPRASACPYRFNCVSSSHERGQLG